MTVTSTAEVDEFVAGLRRCGTEARIRGKVVVFAVEVPVGPLAGTRIETAAEVAELAMWPVAPPHWVHLPETVTFARTNLDRTDCLPGWVRHSRQIVGWGLSDATEPAQAWLGHVRAVLAEAA